MRKILFLLLIVMAGPGYLFPAGAEELSWQACVKEAARNHPDLISAQQKTAQQEAAKRISASGLYPQIKANLGLSTSERKGGQSTSGSVSGSSTRSVTDTVTYGVTGNQLIFDGFKTVNEVNAAKENIKASGENYRFASTQVRLNLRNAFINLLKAQELIKVTNDIVKIRRDNLVLITLRYQSGLEHRGALLTAEANLAQANFQLNQARRDIELAQWQMTKEMGRSEFKPIEVTSSFGVSDTAKLKPDFAALIKNNPSILQAAAKKNAAFFNIKSTYADFLPQLSGSASADSARNSNTTRSSEWSLGLGVTMPIFEGGLRLAQVSQAQAAFAQAEADERSIRDTVYVSLEAAWVALQDALETVEVQNKSLQAALERSKIAEAQYSTGFITYDNWSIIEDNLVRAKTEYLNAEANALFAEANWIQAKGETLEYAQ